MRVAVREMQLRSWGIGSTQQFVPAMEATVRTITQPHQQQGSEGSMEQPVLNAFPFDIKSMFTALDKADVVRAVELVLLHNRAWRKYSHSTNTSYPTKMFVSWGAGGKPLARVGWVGERAKRGDITIPLTTILAIIKFDLNNAYMECGTHIIEQLFGVPMGSFLSAILADTTVAVAEDTLYTHVPHHIADRITGIRYADDGTILIYAPPHIAQHIFHYLQTHLYPTQLILEVESHTGTYQLLETIVTHIHNHVCIIHRNKNLHQIHTYHRAPYLTYTHASTFSASSRNVIIGALLRAYRNCSSGVFWHILIHTLLCTITEMFVCGLHSLGSIVRGIKYIAYGRGDTHPTFAVLYTLLKHNTHLHPYIVSQLWLRTCEPTIASPD